MTDESTQQPAADQPEETPRRSLWTLLGILCLVVVVVLALLLFRGCVRGEDSSALSGKTIVSVEGADPVPGIVSVWVRESTRIDSALGATGISASSVIDMGGGRYLIVVPEGSEEVVVSRLIAQPGVYDAGRVYESATTD